MVDACIGGKCGVNFFPYGKNLLGLFAFPCEVIIHKKFLKSLRNREFKAGIYEGLKHCILSGDKELFKKLLESIKNNKIDSESLKKVIKVKSDVIEKDANESSVRATLNLGHTFAHAIEAHANKCNRDIMHGEAVLYGLVFAIQLSKLHLKLDSFDLENELLQLTKDCELASINRFISELTMDQVYPAILNDKKNEKKSDTTQWILLEDWACVLKDNNSYLSSIDRKLIEDCLALFKKSLI
jgi:3-dehydroquinate synthetase